MAKRKKMPLFVIDKANRLATILPDQDGQNAQESLLKWFIHHTKEKSHFYVVLISSESLWVETFEGTSRYNVSVTFG